MPTKWDRLYSQFQRIHRDIPTRDAKLVTYVESYQPGEGYTSDTDRSNFYDISVRLDESDDSSRDEAGTNSEIDATGYVLDDIGVTWDDYGDAGEKAMELELRSGRQFRVQTARRQQNGLVELELVEV